MKSAIETVPEKTSDTSERPEGRRAYEPPKVRFHGDIRSTILGGSAGVGDSGSPGTRKPFGH